MASVDENWHTSGDSDIATFAFTTPMHGIPAVTSMPQINGCQDGALMFYLRTSPCLRGSSVRGAGVTGNPIRAYTDPYL